MNRDNLIPWLSNATPLPPASRALNSPNGLLAAGGDLSARRLLEAYRNGIFPWFNQHEPILWWSPDPRMVLFPGEFKISRSLARVLHRRSYEVRCDTVFEQVEYNSQPLQGYHRYSMILPEGEHKCIAILESTVSYGVDITSFWSSWLIVGFGFASGVALFTFYTVVRISRPPESHRA